MSRTSIRRGVSLMEVLISIFVLSVGLLGIAALIPLGRFTIVEASKADRSGACGRAAIRDVKVRRLLDRTTWVDYNNQYVLPCFNGSGSPVTAAGTLPVATYPRVPASSAIDAEENAGLYTSYCLDPILIGRSPGVANLRRFPSHTQPDLLSTTVAGQPEYYPTMRRVTLRPLYSSVSGQRTSVLAGMGPANRLFTWSDDLTFELPEDRSQRPRQFYRFANGAGTYPPLYSGEPGSTAAPADLLSKMSDGAYSWLLTITPVLSEMNQLSFVAAATSRPGRQLYNVSAVVFYKRRLEDPIAPSLTEPKPTERVLRVDANFPGYSGGDIALRAYHSKFTPFAPTEYLEVVPGTWILLAGQVQYNDYVPSTGGTASRVANVFKWYKVETVGEVRPDPSNPSNPTYLERRVTLEGPDFFWQFRKLDPATGAYQYMATMIPSSLRAILVDNVVGVYTITTELDVNPGSIRYGDFQRSSQY